MVKTDNFKVAIFDFTLYAIKFQRRNPEVCTGSCSGIFKRPKIQHLKIRTVAQQHPATFVRVMPLRLFDKTLSRISAQLDLHIKTAARQRGAPGIRTSQKPKAPGCTENRKQFFTRQNIERPRAPVQYKKISTRYQFFL